MNKSAFVRQFAASVPRSEVVSKAKEQGIKLTEQYVSSIRTAAKNRKNATGPSDVERSEVRPTRRNAADSPNAAGVDRQFLTLVLEVGLRRAEELLAGVKTRAASLLR